MPARPEQDTCINIPQFDRATPTAAGECSSIRIEGKMVNHTDVSTPYAVQGLPLNRPQPYFSSPAGSSPEFSSAADSDSRQCVKGLAENSVLDESFGQHCILHVNALQMDIAQRQP